MSDKSWEEFIRHGKAAAGTFDEKDDGSRIVPNTGEAKINAALFRTSPFRRLASVQTASAHSRKPVEDLGNTMLRVLNLPTGELYAMPAATQALLDDSVADVDAWLAEEVKDVFASQETAAFVTGDGVNKPKGILTYEELEVLKVPEITVDALIDLIYKTMSWYRPEASFVLNRRTLSQVQRLKDSDGNYIWTPSPAEGLPSSLLGYPVVEVEDMPDADSKRPCVAFGDFFRGYVIVDRQGIRVLRDPYSAKPYVLFYTTKRVGGGVQDAEAIKLMEIEK